MSFLMLSKGDPAARALLQRAIRARYGPRPLPVESFRLDMQTAVRGPLGLPVRVKARITFVGLTHWRRDKTRTLFGLPVAKTVESFDGAASYVMTGGRVTASQDTLVVASFRRWLWALHALFLTPLMDEDVMLRAVDEHTIHAQPTADSEDVATLTFNADDTLASVSVERYRLADQRSLTFSLRPEGGLQTLSDFVVPVRLVCVWEGEPPQEYAVTGVSLNPTIPLTEFTLQASP
jgi:hypothetical protein